jgi:predicted DCC family thiol-disulfide oxidoreductase YuxK
MAAPRAQVAGPPLRRLTVLYDPDCRLCSFASGWLARQRQLVPLDLVPVGSPEAVRRFPALDHTATRKEVTVVGDAGQVYRGDSAWIVCLWALADHRRFSHTLTSPAGRKLARAAVLRAAKYRESSGERIVRQREQQKPGVRRRIETGWTYDPVSGWTQSDVAAEPEQCGDGCSPSG